MKKALIVLLLLLIIGCTGFYFIYRSYMPELIAESIVSGSVPSYLPEKMQQRLNKIQEPLNAGTTEVVKKLNEEHIPLEKVISTIDNISEAQVSALIDELSAANPQTEDQFFDITRKHFPADFDIEIFRESFREHADVKTLRKMVRSAERSRKRKAIDFETGKSILKQLLIEKEKQLQGQ